MTRLSKYCPTYTRLCVWLWHSPTFTTWGNYAAQSLRLLLVTPLILTRFDETEIAAWYLFASLNFFGTTISQRLGLTFSRMFAFAMGGASNLAPIKGKREQENGGQPNWPAFERAYGTVGSLNLGLGWLNVLLALGMGWFGLSNLLAGYEAKGVIWLAFGLMQFSSLFSFIFQRYAIALQGMNYIALSNRWGIIFSLLSIVFGSLTLWLGGGIVALVLVMQVFTVLGFFRKRFLLRAVEGGRVLGFKQYSFDREVFSWAWEPTWKGFVGQFGIHGSVQLTAIIYTAFGSKLEVASFLFSMRMMQTITQIGHAPFSSVQPLMSRQVAAAQYVELKKLLHRRITISLVMTAVGIILAGVSLPFLLSYIGASISFIDTKAWFLMGALLLLFRFDIINGAVCGLGNHIVFYWDLLFAAVISLTVLLWLSNTIGIYGPIISMYSPAILILNIRPFLKAAKSIPDGGRVKWGWDFLILYVGFLLVTAALVFAM